MLWRLECRENSEAIKQPAVYSDIANFFMKQFSFKKAERFVQNKFQHFVSFVIFKCTVVYCRICVHDEIKCVFLFLL